MSDPQAQPSYADKVFSARVSAVQCVYQALMSEESIQDILRKHIDPEFTANLHDSDDLKLISPEKKLLSAIAQGVFERKNDLMPVLEAHYQKKNKTLEPLLVAILLCGAWELLTQQDIDSPIIINDYLDVTHAFYEKNEVSLVNGMLDAMSSVLRQP